MRHKPPTGFEIALIVLAAASFATNLAGSLGAFGDGVPGSGDFPSIDPSDAATAADVELQAAQRRGDQRRSVLAGSTQNDELGIGFPTVLGADPTATPQQNTTLLGG